MATLQARVRQREAAEHDAWFRRQVQAGLDSANAGRLIPAAEVEACAKCRAIETVDREIIVEDTAFEL